MPHVHHSAFESIAVSAVLILLALIYVRGWILARRVCIRKFRPKTIAGWRAAGFLIGLFVVWISVVSPLAGLDHELLTAHMIQHLLLMTVAAPLIVLGSPLRTLLRGLPQRLAQGTLIPMLRSPRIMAWRKALTNPIVCWLGATATLVGWHIPALFVIALHSGVWHGVEHASFLATGILFWMPVVRPWPSAAKWPEWSILLYLFFATLPCDILSGFLVFCDRVVYPVYLSSSQPSGLSPLQDQQCAAALMWTVVTVVYLIAGTVVTARLLAPGRSRQSWIPDSGAQSAAPQAVQRVEAV
jgi:cytochrome c oxidase assembly factor CtaG